MTTENFIRGLWVARCVLCTAASAGIPLALQDAEGYAKKFAGKIIPPDPQTVLYDLGVDSELELLRPDWIVKQGYIDYILALLSLYIMDGQCVAIISFDKCGDVYCVSGNETTDNGSFVVDTQNGKYHILQSVNEAISSSNELARAMFVKLKCQRPEREGRCRARKRIKLGL